MNRRGFLGALLGLIAAPAASVLPAPAAPAPIVESENPLFRGEISHYDGIKIYEGLNDPKAAKVWGDALYDLTRKPRFDPEKYGLITIVSRED